MPDSMTIEQRHNNMAAIRGKDTKPEILVRKFLWARGFRYRLNHPRLPGKPDIVLRKYRTCILVNGCFWHGHEGCKYYVVPKSNTEFWMEKIRRNRERDHEVLHRLAEMAYHRDMGMRTEAGCQGENFGIPGLYAEPYLPGRSSYQEI